MIGNRVLPAILISALMFFYSRPTYWAIDTAIIFAVIFFNRWRFQILMAAAMYYWFDLGIFDRQTARVEVPWEIRLAAWLTCLAVVGVFLLLKKRLRFPVITSLAAFVGILWLGSIDFADARMVGYTRLLAIYFKFFYWYLVLLLIEEETKLRAGALFVMPFWNHSMRTLPTATGSSVLAAHEAQDEQALAASRWAAVKILAVGVVLIYAARALNVMVFATGRWEWLPSLGVPSMRGDFETIHSLQAGLPLWQKWLALIVHVFLRYMDLAIKFALVIGQARAVGFMLPPMMNAPWKANSFGDLFSRLLYYYNRLLMKVFYPRIKDSLGFIRNARLRVIVALFLSISVGGMIYHYPRDGRSDYFREGFWFSVGEYVDAAPYFSVLALFVAMTVYFRNKRYQPPRLWRAVRPFVYFTVFSLIYSLYMAGIHNRGSWQSYYKYLLSLVNLS